MYGFMFNVDTRNKTISVTHLPSPKDIGDNVHVDGYDDADNDNDFSGQLSGECW